MPVSKERHANWSVQAGEDFAFSKNVNAVPIVAAEIAAASDEYPIVFVETQPGPLPCVLVGLRDNENLCVDEDGHWIGRYIPAFIKRYPFVFSETKEQGTFTVCIDEAYPGFNTTGAGNRLFDDEGEATPYLQKMLEFLKQIQVQTRASKEFSAKLAELDLLAPMQAKFRFRDGQDAQLRGFLAVDKNKLTALPDDRLGELTRSNALEAIYLHLHSLHHLGRLAERVDGPASAEESKGKER